MTLEEKLSNAVTLERKTNGLRTMYLDQCNKEFLISADEHLLKATTDKDEAYDYFHAQMAKRGIPC